MLDGCAGTHFRWLANTVPPELLKPVFCNLNCSGFIAITIQQIINLTICFLIFLPRFLLKSSSKLSATCNRVLISMHLTKICIEPNFNTRTRPANMNTLSIGLFDNLIKADNSVVIKYNPGLTILWLKCSLFLTCANQLVSFRFGNFNYNSSLRRDLSRVFSSRKYNFKIII